MPIRRNSHRALVALTILVAAGSAFAGLRTVSWSPSSGASGYKVHFGAQPEAYSTTVDVGNVTQATIQQNLDDCTTWYFAVTAYNTIGESDYSAEVPWLTPMTISSAAPVNPGQAVRQGTQFTMNIAGAGFNSGAAISVNTPGWSNCNGSGCAALQQTVRLQNPSISCNTIQVAATVEPVGSGGTPAETGIYSITVTNPDNSTATRQSVFTVALDPLRFDVDPAGDGTLDVKDLTTTARMFGSCDPARYGSGQCPGGDPAYQDGLDFNGDGWVDGDDLAHVCSNFGLDWNTNAWNWVCPAGGTCVHF